MWVISKLRSARVANSPESFMARVLAASFLFFLIKGLVWLAIFGFAWVRLFAA
jgi:hypothetical protein